MAATEDRYQRVLVKTWNGQSFRSVSDHARLLFLYLLTCPATSQLPGLVCLTVGTMADAMRWPVDAVRVVLAELDAEGMAAFDPAGLVWLPAALDYNPPASSANVKGWSRPWREAPTCPLKVIAYQALRRWCAAHPNPTILTAFDATCAAPVLNKPASSRTQWGTPGGGLGGRVGGSPQGGLWGSPRGQEQEQEQEQEREKNTAGPPAGACVRTYTHESPDDTQPPETSRSGAVASVMAQTALAAPVAPLATPDAPEVPPAPAAPRTAQPEAGAVGPGSLQLTLTPADPPPAPPAAKGRSPLATCRPDSPEARVFAHWAQTLYPKAKPIFTRDRQLRIAARLAEGHSVETLCKAIDGVTFSDYHMGRDPAHADKDYRGLETVLRDAGQVDKFAAIAERKDPRHRPQVTRRVDARRAQLDAEVAALMATPMGDAEALAQIAYFNETGKIPNAAQMAALLAGRSVRDAIAMLTTTTAAEEVTA